MASIGFTPCDDDDDDDIAGALGMLDEPETRTTTILVGSLRLTFDTQPRPSASCAC